MAYLARYANSHCSSANQVGENRLTLPRINFFTWFLIWRVPTLRILLNFAKCDENWELEEGLVGTVFQKVLRSKFPEWVILFPEVNIWTPEDASLQNKQSEKYYLPVLRNLLYPRFSGFANTMCAMKSAGNFKFTKIYDITLLYQKHIPSGSAADDTMYTPTLLESFTSKSPITITINVQTKSLSRIPVKRTKLERYLEHTWRDKDKLLIQLRTKAPHIENSASASLPNSLLQPEKPSSSIEGLISNDPSI
ncbi:uncharacterized protein RJT20DRAFT_54878 [Scheffersomyces xylosifermentans]|uniref:uncharacterized protein n=1 Tax=Scheffersomyces xylosifermentans TaxID=1304137 RepID=UPI00315D78A2